MKYVEVLLPLPLANTFTYRIPEAMVHMTGLYCLVVAPFGKNQYYTGLITELHDRCPDASIEVKAFYELVDTKPVIKEPQLPFWRWLSSYYTCTLGEVYRAALPKGLKVESETLKAGFKPKTETHLRLADHIQTEGDLHQTLDNIKRAKQQEKLLLDFLVISGIVSVAGNNESISGNVEVVASLPELNQKQTAITDSRFNQKTTSKKTLLDYSGVSAAVLNGLMQRGVLVAEEKVVSRMECADKYPDKWFEETTALSEVQQQAVEAIKQSFTDKDITLLHNDLPVGKMNVYIRLIQETLAKGLQALYLLPEIALTTQTTAQLRKVFGRQLLVYNSGMSDNERVEIWLHIQQTNEPFVVLGVRSSIFLPFDRLGLIIVDEEQDASYKQQDPAPRYHARNAAMILANQQGAKTLLGSVTPSLESWLWATKGKYGYVKMDNRREGYPAPAIEIVNVSDLRRKRRMKDTLFSPLLKSKIDEVLSKGEQALLFQNRRGFAPLVTCQQCGAIPHCANCDVSLTYHKQKHHLVCHYCGYTIPFPLRCVACNSEELKVQGFGTEKIEEEVATLFPATGIARLDFDTAHTERAYQRILNAFEAGKIQILIGTQMIAKGLQGANVGVVGILNADALMSVPDFRAYERAFQLMLQVSGYAFRKDRQGCVVIQTMQDENVLLQMVRKFDYQGMAQIQLQERHQFRYPPYTRLIMLILRSPNEQVLDEISELYAQQLRVKMGTGVTGPVYPPVARVQTLHVRKIMLRLEPSIPVSATRAMLEEVRSAMQKNPLFRQVILHYDVDPQ